MQNVNKKLNKVTSESENPKTEDLDVLRLSFWNARSYISNVTSENICNAKRDIVLSVYIKRQVVACLDNFY